MRKFKSETAYRKFLIPELEGCTAEVFSIVGSKMQKNGYPDIIVDHPYYHGYVEFKGHDTVLEIHQYQRIKLLLATGANVLIVRAPNRVEDEEGNLLLTFPLDLGNPGIHLLIALHNCAQRHDTNCPCKTSKYKDRFLSEIPNRGIRKSFGDVADF